MRSLWKDIFTAVTLGFVVPSVLLNFGVLLMRRQEVQIAQITQPQQTEPECVLSLLEEDGSGKNLKLEEYLVGVVLAEMPADFELEALKAQAVAARTYTRKALEMGGKHGSGNMCTQSSCCQGYVDSEVYLSRGGTQEGLGKIQRAVSDTQGLCLSYRGELIEATYFSASGGRTEDALAVWGTEYPYLRCVDSPGEKELMQTRTFTPEQLSAALDQNLSGDPEQWFGTVTYTEGGGVASMVIGTLRYTGTELRTLLGLRSTVFTVAAAENAISFTTKGYGHRVGMSQYGADAMAAGGSTFRQILAHYYPGTEVMHCP